MLFSSGKKEFKYPILLFWKEIETTENMRLKVGFSVPKKHVKKAVARNRIKRVLREAYRTQSGDLKRTAFEANKQLALLFVVTGGDNISFDEVSPKIMLLLRKVEGQIQK